MTAMSPDSDLVGAYVTERSEIAFRALVARHANLVYATALRQVGDRGLAEEITQNVFIALGKNAPRLGGMQTLAGWLHRATILEAKARIRSELRRRTREETAAVLASLEREGESSLDPMIPLVDEALLHLCETDRLALVLRFFENHSLREVGAVLGTDEDAARKRVSRALDRLSEFFRQRGFAVPAGVGMAGLLSSNATAAPAAHLISATTTAALAAGGTAGGFNLFLFHFMNASKTKTLIVTALLASVPLF
jgi:RNA polymerase sigma factor (sigma-70 family)